MGRTAELASSGAAPVPRDPLVRLNTATFDTPFGGRLKPATIEKREANHYEERA